MEDSHKIAVFEWIRNARLEKTFSRLNIDSERINCIHRTVRVTAEGHQVQKYNTDHPRGLVGTPPRLLSPHGAECEARGG